MSNDKKYFPKGLFYNEPHPKAPDFVMGNINIKVSEFKAYLDKVNGDTLKLDLKVNKEGKGYAEVNTYKPEKKDVDGYPKSSQQKNPTSEISHDFDDSDDDLPFIWLTPILLPIGYLLSAVI